MSVELRDSPPSPPPTLYAGEHFGRATAAHEGGEWKYLSNDDGTFGIPLVIRSIPNSDLVDAVTPYGYGGIHIDESLSDEEAATLWAEALEVMNQAGIVSVFFRFPPFIPRQAERAAKLPGLDVERVSSTFLVKTDDPDAARSRLHKSCRRAVRRAQEAGFVTVVEPPSKDNMTAFRQLYEASMSRLNAQDGYFFGDEYFDGLAGLGESMKVSRVVAPSGDTVAASLLMTDDRIAHAHLSGAAPDARGVSNLRLWDLVKWCAESDVTDMHMGGGIREGDSLSRFKQSFGGEQVDFLVGRLVVNERVYRSLVGRQRDAGHGVDGQAGAFFPAYRANMEVSE